MNDRDSDRAEAIRQIAQILTAAYIRLQFPPDSPPGGVDCAETKSESCE